MVIRSGFRVELAEACTKKAFKEHIKDGKVYFEVEPDTEYFVSVQKIAKLTVERCLLELDVDDQCLGWRKGAHGPLIDARPEYYGLMQDAQGIISSRALKFVKPSYVNRNSDDASPPMLFGTVRLKVYEAGAEYTDQRNMYQDFTASLARPTVAVGNTGNETKKNLRSSEGIGLVHMAQRNSIVWERGRLLDVITLHYCSAVGLMNVGVLAKPDIYAWHRMNTKKRQISAVKSPIVTPKRIRRCSTVTVNGKKLSNKEEFSDLFDLSELPSDDEGAH
jgi:hypothetical protein